VLTLDDDRTPRSVDDLLHKDIATLVSRAVGLADVLVAEVTEHVLDHILELEPERSSSTAIPNYVDAVRCNCPRTNVAERSLVLILNPVEGHRAGKEQLERTSAEPTYEWNQRPALTYSHGPRLIPTSSPVNVGYRRRGHAIVENNPNRSKTSSRQSGVSEQSRSWRIIQSLGLRNGDMVAAGRPSGTKSEQDAPRLQPKGRRRVTDDEAFAITSRNQIFIEPASWVQNNGELPEYARSTQPFTKHPTIWSTVNLFNYENAHVRIGPTIRAGTPQVEKPTSCGG